ncbi:head protein [Sphingomonas parva]|uniref:Head protein n=1 Tax=Sphingomonas parva TaxID=2555898 RepID=A0A4Y8ZST6_9SPHN|nr:DUF5309 domain-containing protein [Sphingomonas parva]TFI59108.1 head protein [Sphingomonas parva]
MAVPINTTKTYDVAGRREDLTDVIHDVSPTDTPFMTAIGKGSASHTNHEWQTDALAPADGDNAVLEGDDAANDAAAATVRLGNYTQLMDKVIQVSSSQRAADNAGRGDELSYQLMKRSKELKRDMETRLTGNYPSVAGNAGAARKCAGFEAWIQSNDSRGVGGASTAFAGGLQAAATDGAARPFTEQLLLDVMQSCWNEGGEPRLVLVGGFNKRAASTFSGIATQYRENSGQKKATIVAAADVYVTDFGTVNIVASRFSRPRSALVVDPGMWKLCYYQRFRTEDLAKTGHSERKMLSVEFTLEACNEKSSGVVADLNVA